MMTNEAREAMDSKKLTFVVPLDLSKAFESTDHRRLLCNLNALGIDRAVLEWFRSYVGVGSEISSLDPITHGVPQRKFEHTTPVLRDLNRYFPLVGFVFSIQIM